MTSRDRITACVVLIGLSIGGAAAALAAGPVFDYASSHASAVAKCGAVDPAEYQTGLLFNPVGYRSFYVRSVCFQETAVLFRDDSLCAQARERRSLFFSSWGYSPARCRALVREGAAADLETLEEMKRRYQSDGIVLGDFRIDRNGNGRDFDILPTFTGRDRNRYLVEFDIVDPDGRRPVLLYADTHYLDANSDMRLFVRQSDLRTRFPDLALGRTYRVRATVSLEVGSGGPAGYWSPAFLERVFPARERTRSLTRDVRF
jgi:hypothetical protein